MAYIGKAPNTAIVNQATSQSFSGNGSTTAFTLNRSVNVGEDLEVFVNNVQQEPGSGKSYTASGTTLTFDEAPPSGTNNVYVIYRGEATINPRLEHDANAALAATTGTFSGDFVATGHASVGVNAVDASRALTVAGSTDDSSASALVVYNSSLASKFTVRNDGLVTTAGNVGINTASPSGANLEIFTGSTAADGLKINRFGSGVYYSTLRQDSHGLAVHVGDGSNISERAAITPNGITFGGQTAAANSLDSYEEGQWTPNVFNAGYSSNFTTKKGDYIRVGKVVHCWFVCDHGTTNSGSGSGTLTLQGMPYSALVEATAGSNFAMNATQSIGIWGANPSQQVGNLFTNNSATDFLLYMGGSNKAGQLTYVSGQFSYIAQ